MGEGIAETGSDRRTEVSDSCGGLPHTRFTPHPYLRHSCEILLGEKRGDVEAAKRRAIQLFLNRNLCPMVCDCDAALHWVIMAMNGRNDD